MSRHDNATRSKLKTKCTKQKLSLYMTRLKSNHVLKLTSSMLLSLIKTYSLYSQNHKKKRKLFVDILVWPT